MARVLMPGLRQSDCLHQMEGSSLSGAMYAASARIPYIVLPVSVGQYLGNRESAGQNIMIVGTQWHAVSELHP